MAAEHDTKPTRLYRSRDDRMIAGIAGGMGAYLGVDPVLIRLAIVALTLAGGAGAVAYVIAWIIIPEEPASGVATEASPARAAGGNGREGASTGGTTARIAVGAILIGIGAILLLERAVPAIDDIAWPLLVIAVGIGMLIYGTRR